MTVDAETLYPDERLDIRHNKNMNFQQLRIIHETVRQNYNLTEAANALFTSQSGVSKHIKDLEDELGIELFVRKGKRLLGLTDPGKELVEIVERILLDAKNVKRLAEQFSNRDQGRLTIATTHTQARYALPSVVTQFKKAFPQVHLVLHQASPGEIVSMLLDGQADIGIATEALEEVEELASFPYYSWHHAVIVPPGHPLESVHPLTLEAIAEFPIITYHEGFTGRKGIDQTFAKRRTDTRHRDVGSRCGRHQDLRGAWTGDRDCRFDGLQPRAGHATASARQFTSVREKHYKYLCAARPLPARLCLSFYRALPAITD